MLSSFFLHLSNNFRLSENRTLLHYIIFYFFFHLKISILHAIQSYFTKFRAKMFDAFLPTVGTYSNSSVAIIEHITLTLYASNKQLRQICKLLIKIGILYVWNILLLKGSISKIIIALNSSYSEINDSISFWAIMLCWNKYNIIVTIF